MLDRFVCAAFHVYIKSARNTPKPNVCIHIYYFYFFSFSSWAFRLLRLQLAFAKFNEFIKKRKIAKKKKKIFLPNNFFGNKRCAESFASERTNVTKSWRRWCFLSSSNSWALVWRSMLKDEVEDHLLRTTWCPRRFSSFRCARWINFSSQFHLCLFAHSALIIKWKLITLRATQQ